MQEPGSLRVRELAAGRLATSRLSEVEVASALVRRWRESAFGTRERDRALDRLERDLAAMVVVELVPAVTTRARALLTRHPLRAGDAIQLASCLELRHALGADILFACFDVRLSDAAVAEGLRLP